MRGMTNGVLLELNLVITISYVSWWAAWFLNHQRVTFLEAMLSRCESEGINIKITYKHYFTTRLQPRKYNIFSVTMLDCPSFIEVCRV